MNITLRQIRYFLAVVENFSVSGAARELGVSQSAVTTAIQQLEDNLQALLFIRRAKGMELTYEGHQFINHAKRILATVADAGNAVRARTTEITGSMTLGVTSMVAGYFLADLLSRYKRIFPMVEVRVIEDERDYIEHLLINGEVDVGILIVSSLKNQDALEAEALLHSRNQVWVSANHPLTEQGKVTLADITNEPVIMLDADEMAARTSSLWRQAGLRPNVVLHTSSVEAVRSLVATGIGITVLPDMAYRPWSLEGDRLEVAAIRDPLPTIDIGLVWRRGSSLSDAVRNFNDLAREHSKSRARQSGTSAG